MKINRLLLTDSYKLTHWKQYPPNTTNVYSYFESRGGKFNETVFFGLSYIIQEYLSKPITMKEVLEARDFAREHLKDEDLFNYDGWRYIVEHHGGNLPVIIKAVPEGMRIKVSTPLITIENTDPKCFWLTNYLETLLVQVWYPITVATLSYNIKQVILKALNETGDPSLINYKLHDFGFRGVSSVESAAIGGAAHLLNFDGTDTMPAIQLLNEYYSSNLEGTTPKFFYGVSIPASEHSTITSWGKNNEVKAFENMINQYGYNFAYACVSDSYDIYKACKDLWGNQLKDQVLNANGTLVVRPDSGDPKTVVIEVLNILAKAFGYTVNNKGYMVLNPKVRVIQGDGVNYESIQEILDAMKSARFSADNIAFGCGGALLQKLDRDTQKFAFKCSYIKGKGFERNVFKSPIHDAGKRSKLGKFGDLQYYLTTYFENGLIKHKEDLYQIRERLNK